MSSPRKYHPHGSVLSVTMSIEEGLLLLANPLCRAIIESALARAQHLHPVRISHFIVNGTHLHLTLVVYNPADVPDFIERFKTESAHLFNRVLGRKKRTIWCESYDSPVVLTETRALTSIAYLYANPAKDELIDSIDEFPGLSSWEMFQSGVHTKECKRLRRDAFRALRAREHNEHGYTKEAERLLAEAKESHTLTLSPNAWLEAFGILNPEEQKRWNERLIAQVRTLEEEARKERGSKPPMGRARLLAQPLDRYYQSKNRCGKRMWCLADSSEERVSFINYLKDLIAEAKRIYRKWFLGDFSEPYPLGLYPPAMPKQAEIINGW
jgi:REP element-mobilizing transposase RayT